MDCSRVRHALFFSKGLVTNDKNQLKEVFKQAFAELLQERRDLLYDVFTEVFEDIALANAIKEGEETEIVSREQVFKL